MPVEVRLERDDSGALVAYERFPDWIYYGFLGPEAVTIEPGGRNAQPTVAFDGLYGPVTLTLDEQYRELIGGTASAHPAVALHIKRALPPPTISIVERELVVPGVVPLAATLVLPEGDGPHGCVVHLAGRGCSTRSRMLGQARVLAEYGVASLVFDKRGSSSDAFSCDDVTFAMVVDDAVAAYELAIAQPEIDPARTGLKGGSAGAWTAQGVAERALASPTTPTPAFIITWIGPATSIEQQQRDAAEAIAQRLGLDEQALALAFEQMELAMDRQTPSDELFLRFERIRKQAEEGGWFGPMFAPSDFPANAEAIDTVWLRRFSYDPTNLLRSLEDTPYLAVFGELDDVVPLEKNEGRLRSLLDEAGNSDLTIVTIPGQRHSTEHGDMSRTLRMPGPDLVYWKFDRVEPLFMESTIGFLREHGIATR
ncbi:MAG: alpha/beta hydrolase fold domain-containing protein [Phycisphaerales bacterium]|nr:alpha/beta hydrolase fold domain-containing protein [Phycisphaerales bacterium]